MQITHLEYTRVLNLGNFENVKLSATGQVLEDESTETAMQELRDWVELQVMQAADLALERRRDLNGQVEREHAERSQHKETTPW